MMSAFAKYALPLTLLFFLCAVPSVAGSIIGPRLEEALQNGAQESTFTVWIYFTDKGSRELQKSAVPSSVVTEQSLRRRAKVLPPERLTDYADLPVEDAYVAELGASGAVIQHRSKWFNAVSIRATARQIGTIASLPFVREIELVGRYKRSTPPPPDPKDVIETPVLPKNSGTHALDYGPSLNQLTQIQVPDLHDLGNNAQGVIVGVFDNGFRLPDHEALRAMNVIATYDFVDNKVSVVPNNTSPSFGTHGVNTLSTIGGFKEGQLVGPAYGASFILARTENDSSETPLEEDKWVRAIEWADSLGVQVTSTSLGYLDYNTGYPSWTWEDMDGRTTVITRAAAMAVRKGILVVNSAGNEGYDPTHNTLGAPADADSVLTVGAVNLSGKRTSFSSVGPTTASPPRIKPDVMALGTGVYIASSTQTDGYSSFGQGTSFACPLAAGVAALLVKARPDATPMEIANAMRQTASQASAPDNLMGWGVVNALAAYNLLSGIDTVPIPPRPTDYILAQNFPNPFNPGTKIRYSVPVASDVSLTIHDVLGREVVTLERGFTDAGTHQTEWDGRDARGVAVATGMYIYRLTGVKPDGSRTVVSNTMMLIR
jgi:subtilisin family serine protease